MGTRSSDGRPARSRRWQRFVAIGDSSTEGMDDPDGAGGYRGWADRLAGHVASAQGGLEYANLAIRGRLAAQIRAEQLPTALALKPDLATVLAGMNDVLTTTFDPVAVAADVAAMFAALRDAGATVLSFTLPDPTPNLPLTRRLRPRVSAFNSQLRLAAARTGVIMVDVASFPDASDPRLWSPDRLHGNQFGHERVAHALAHGLGLPGFDDSWRQPLPVPLPRGLVESVRDDVAWARHYALPWLWRALRGRSAGDGRSAKLPEPVSWLTAPVDSDPHS
ncbi:MAG TPA: SGNH/GDSL hydrolase family protein [Micromonosporaceae bacterium]